MRQLFFTIALIICACAFGDIETGYSRFYKSEDLRSLTSYLKTEEDLQQRFRTLIPSDPDSIEGQYFIVKHEKASQRATSAKLTYIASDSKETRTVVFQLPAESSKWLYFGLTNEDWPDEKIKPLAWKLELIDSNDSIVDAWKSFLWEM